MPALMDPTLPEQLSERETLLMKSLVERYILDGQPVGSRTLSREHNLSPATIRNVMSDLEALGLICSPHTSAGRIPTVQGYRFFVDSLLSVKPLDHPLVTDLQAQLGLQQDSASIIAKASNALAEVTQMAGVVTLPFQHYTTLKHIEFMQLSPGRVLAIVVTTNDEVKNHVLEMEQALSREQLQEMAAYLNKELSGKTLPEIREVLLNDINRARETADDVMANVVQMASQVFDDTSEQDKDYLMTGQSNLMDFGDLTQLDRLKQLFQAFEEKRGILSVFDRCMNTSGIQIFIGEESGYQAFDDCSIVGAPYEVDGRVVGVLGVIGPTRMNYDRVIPIVDATARILGAALSPKDDDSQQNK